MEENKCPICGLVVTGDVIKHLTSEEHEAALKVLLEKEAAQPRVQPTSGGRGKNKGQVVTATRG